MITIIYKFADGTTSEVEVEDEPTGRASKNYKKSFWNAMRNKAVSPTVMNALQEGTDSEGGRSEEHTSELQSQ